ncbi:MAG: ribonuclease [Pseudomonadota bacterium]
MPLLHRLLMVAGLLVVASCEERETGSNPPFDFYVLSLSWSPSYCAAEGDEANRMQCEDERKYGFIVHGLWPQFEEGYPEFCNANPDRVDAGLVSDLLDIMPSRGLIRHQWRKHGTCTGFSQTDYFRAVRAAHESIALPQISADDGSYRVVSPDQVGTAFQSSNPGLKDEHFAVTCDNRRLREVRICMSMDFTFRSCPEVTRRACRRASIVVPPSRGG